MSSPLPSASSTPPANSGPATSASAGAPPAPVGVVRPDSPAASNLTCTVDATAEGAARFERDVYVGIADEAQGVEFLGRVVAGPFYATDGAGDGHHLTGTVEVLGQLVDGERVRSTSTRPRPGAPVYVLPQARLERLLGLGGDVALGHLAGHDGVGVRLQSDEKNFLPRNVGIFGTVGSGKSNTAQVLAEEAVAAGWAVVLIDVEGEYVRMDEPLDQPALAALLDREHGLRPEGVRDFRVYVPASGQSDAAAAHPFKVPVAELDAEVLADILELSDAERRVYAMATTYAAREHGSAPGADPDGPPFTLQHLVDGLMEGAGVGDRPTIRLLPLARAHDVPAASQLRSKLLHLARTGMLDVNDTAEVPPLPVDDLLVGGRLSVLDVSETDDRSRNLAIAHVLQSLFDRVITTGIGEPLASGQPRPPVLVVIEEVHTFVSRSAAPKMRAVLDGLQVISRRGRKRWMGLALVSQQPNHVPDEIFELANTRFIHQLRSLSNLEPIKETTGSVDETLWSSVPGMSPGRCLLTGAIVRNPVFVDVRPARSRRLLVA
ncbi:MAG: ATP-binding protein [Rubricoccaceae bacterium]|nr:ATP-binding protein [Rubricoccaceae bacterium]